MALPARGGNGRHAFVYVVVYVTAAKIRAVGAAGETSFEMGAGQSYFRNRARCHQHQRCRLLRDRDQAPRLIARHPTHRCLVLGGRPGRWRCRHGRSPAPAASGRRSRDQARSVRSMAADSTAALLAQHRAATAASRSGLRPARASAVPGAASCGLADAARGMIRRCRSEPSRVVRFVVARCRQGYKPWTDSSRGVSA